MRSLKPILWIAVLIVAGVFAYRYLHRAPHSPEQFHAILILTPQALQTRCGAPELDTRGVVVENDGIRDLRYRDASGAKIVFRFISDDGAHWESLGAWEQVNAPDDLGNPVAAFEAARRLPCAAKTDDAGSDNSSLTPSHAQREIPGMAMASYLAVILQDIPLPTPHPMSTPPVVFPTPAPTPIPMTTTGPMPYPGGPSPGTQPVPRPAPRPGPGSRPSPASGPDPGPKPPAAHIPMILPCPSVSEPCELLQYAQFIAEFNQAIEAERENNFESAMNRLTDRGVMMVQLPSLEVSRAQAVRAVVQLEVRAINIVEARLRDDVAHLEPFSSDSAAVKAQKMAVVEQDDQQRRQMWKQAVESNRPAASTSHPSSGSTMRFNSEAYQQLVQIHLSGSWQ